MVKINERPRLNRKEYSTCLVNGIQTFEFTVVLIGVYRLFSSLEGSTNDLRVVISVS